MPAGAWHTMAAMQDPLPRRIRAVALLGATLLVAGATPSYGCSGPAKEEVPGSQPPTGTAPRAAVSPPAPLARNPAPTPDKDPVADVTPVPDSAVDGLAALTADQRSTLWSGTEDAPLKVDTHYIQSNETRHDLFFPYIDEIGGALIGVGSDQSFTIAAAAQSELVFMSDIDTRVVELHQMYAVLVPAAESAEALVAAFHEDNEDATNATLTSAMSDLPADARTTLLRGYRVGRETVYRHLLRVISRTVDGEPASWLSDPDKFAHIQDLYRKGRVRMMVGNLAGTASMRTIGAICTKLEIPVRVLYMSNAEEYFKYTADFRKNIEALPIDDASMVVRTIYSKKWEHADLWAYQVQPLADFKARLADGLNRSRNTMLRRTEAENELTRTAGPKGLSVVGMEPKSRE